MTVQFWAVNYYWYWSLNDSYRSILLKYTHSAMATVGSTEHQVNLMNFRKCHPKSHHQSNHRLVRQWHRLHRQSLQSHQLNLRWHQSSYQSRQLDLQWHPLRQSHYNQAIYRQKWYHRVLPIRKECSRKRRLQLRWNVNIFIIEYSKLSKISLFQAQSSTYTANSALANLPIDVNGIDFFLLFIQIERDRRI